MHGSDDGRLYSRLLNQFSGILQGGTLGAAGVPSAAAPLVIIPTAGPEDPTAPPSPSSAIKLAYSLSNSDLGAPGAPPPIPGGPPNWFPGGPFRWKQSRAM